MANVINLDAIVERMVAQCDFNEGAEQVDNPALRKWTEDRLREALQSMTYAMVCKELSIGWKPALTARELRLMGMFRKGLSAGELSSNGKVLGSTSYHVLMPADIEANPWMSRALAEGDDIVWFDPRSDGGVLAHWIDAVKWKYPRRETYSLSLQQARDTAKEWQRWLDKLGKEEEGSIEVLLLTPPDGALSNTQIVKLLDKQALAREGYLMHHCVGSYDITAETDILSIRQGTQILATVEVWKYLTNPGEYGAAIVKQIRGPSNTPVGSEVDTFVRSFVHAHWSQPTETQRASTKHKQPSVWQMLAAMAGNRRDEYYPHEIGGFTQALGRISRPGQQRMQRGDVVLFDPVDRESVIARVAALGLNPELLAGEASVGGLGTSASALTTTAEAYLADQNRQIADTFGMSAHLLSGATSAGYQTLGQQIANLSDNDLQAMAARFRQAGIHI
jgi:hypothetical protein